MTVTTTIDAPATGQGDAPAEYAAALAGLARARTREGMAAILDKMAQTAGQAGRDYMGTGTPYSSSDPLTWHETASLLAQMAAVLRGHRLDTDEIRDKEYWQDDYWENLATAFSASEFASNFTVFSTDYTAKLNAIDADGQGDCDIETEEAPDMGEEPAGAKTARRRIAWRRLCEVADTVIAAWPAQ